MGIDNPLPIEGKQPSKGETLKAQEYYSDMFHENLKIMLYIVYPILNWGSPGSASGKELTCQSRKHKGRGLDP